MVKIVCRHPKMGDLNLTYNNSSQPNEGGIGLNGHLKMNMIYKLFFYLCSINYTISENTW